MRGEGDTPWTLDLYFHFALTFRALERLLGTICVFDDNSDFHPQKDVFSPRHQNLGRSVFGGLPRITKDDFCDFDVSEMREGFRDSSDS